MFAYVIITVLALNAEVVQNYYITDNYMKSEMEESSSMMSSSSSSSKSSYGSKSSMGEGYGSSIYEKSESAFSSANEQSSKSSSKQTYISSSTDAEDAIDIDMIENTFSQCTSLDSSQLELYVNCMRKILPEDFCYFRSLIENLNNKEQFLNKESIKYDLVNKKINQVYDKLNREGLYKSNCKWNTKKEILEGVEQDLISVLKAIKPDCVLYKPLDYCINKNHMEMVPMVCGLNKIVLEGQKPYLETKNMYSSYGSKNDESPSVNTKKGSDNKNTKYENILKKCTSIHETDRELYIKYLSELSDEGMKIFDEIIENINSKEQYITNEMITDFTSLQKRIKTIYELFVKEQIYIKDCNWLKKKNLFESIKTEIKDALKLINKKCCLYKSMHWCLEDENIHLLPIIIGMDNVILSSQSSYFSSSTSTTTQSSTRTISSEHISKYETALQKCSSIKQAEKELYINYLSKISEEDSTYFSDIFKYINSKEQFITKDMINDFTQFKTKITEVYDLFVDKQIYVKGCNWLKKKSTFDKAKAELKEALKLVNKECCLYKSLHWCLEDKNIHLLPIIVGMDNIILSSQSSYFSSSTSTTTQSNTRTISSEHISKYEKALQKCPSIKQIEKELYITYLSKISEEDSAYFSDIFKYINSKEKFITKDMINDFTQFKTKITEVYDLFVDKQIYVKGCDWLKKKSTFDKAKAELKEALKLVNKECCLYKSLHWCLEDKNIHLLPIIVGMDNIILSSQSSYFSSSTSTTTQSNTRTISSEHISKYEKALQKCPSIKQIEKELYITYLSKISEEDSAYFSDIFKYINSKEKFITKDMINDFTQFKKKITEVYDLFVDEQIYVKGSNWLKKKCLFKKAKAELKEALKLINKKCCLYRSLQWCLEDKNIHLLPIIIGMDNAIISTQSTYYDSQHSCKCNHC